MFLVFQIVSLVASDNVSIQRTLCRQEQGANLKCLCMKSLAIMLAIILTVILDPRFVIDTLLLFIHQEPHLSSDAEICNAY